MATLVAGPLLVLDAGRPLVRLALSCYVASLVALFGVSAAYHRLRVGPRVRRALRRADHTTIFVAIAGTYTGVAATALHGWARPALLGVVWAGAAGGVALRQWWLDAPKWAVAVPYVVVGWSGAIAFPQLERGLGPTGFALVLAGGLCYSLGALVYARRRFEPLPGVIGFHEVFHALTVAGAGLQFAAILLYGLAGR